MDWVQGNSASKVRGKWVIIRLCRELSAKISTLLTRRISLSSRMIVRVSWRTTRNSKLNQSRRRNRRGNILDKCNNAEILSHRHRCSHSRWTGWWNINGLTSFTSPSIKMRGMYRAVGPVPDTATKIIVKLKDLGEVAPKTFGAILGWRSSSQAWAKNSKPSSTNCIKCTRTNKTSWRETTTESRLCSISKMKVFSTNSKSLIKMGRTWRQAAWSPPNNREQSNWRIECRRRTSNFKLLPNK